MKQSHSILGISSRWLAGMASSLLLAGQTLVGAADLPALVYPDFHNSLSTGANPATTIANSAAMFTGTLGAYSPPGSGTAAVLPGGGTNRLVQSYFGQTFSENIPYPGFETNAIAMAQVLLYPPPTVTTPTDIANGDTAFRYKEIQYRRDAVSGQVRLDFDSIASLFGAAERTKIQTVLNQLREALKYAPFNRDLRHALLDVYYDWIVAEQQLAKEKRADTARYRLGLLPIPLNEFIIDQEIANQTNILAQYDAIWTSYSGLLYERAGLDLRRFVPGETLPLGSFIFREEQPFRNQLAASFRDTNGLLMTFSNDGSVTGGSAPTLFAGYKDYVGLVGLMRDYVETAAEAARLHAMRGRISPGVDDPAAAAALMRRAQTEAFVNLACLEGLLPNGRTAASDASGVSAAWDGILTAMGELEAVAGFLRGDKNALGFDPDMLVLFQSPAGANQVSDSYDAIMQWINPDVTGFTVLGFAKKRFADAFSNYEKYRGYADQVAAQISENNDSYADRYEEITGYSPAEPVDPWPVPKPVYPWSRDDDQPTHVSNPGEGSDLYNAYQEVIHADTQKATLDELGSLIKSQLEDVNVSLAEANQYSSQIYEATERYKDTIRRERDVITAWNASQAASQVNFDIANSISQTMAGGGIDDFYIGPLIGSAGIAVVGGINLAIQTAGENEKGKAEKELDLASANFERDMANAGVNEGALAAASEIRGLDREKISLAVERNDVALMGSSALGTIARLRRELGRIAANQAENNTALAGRYFADPIHFLRAQASIIAADFAFREAQRWVFFALRALEYKFNRPFLWDDGARTWEVTSLYGLRNFAELEEMLAAMSAFNALNSGTLANGRQTVTDQISLRHDVWKLGTNDASLPEFRSRLRQTLNTGRGFYEVTLNTVVLSRDLNKRENQGNFFVGPEYDLQGKVSGRGSYADKIDGIKFHFIDRRLTAPQSRQANFIYGGVTYGRSFCARDLNSEAEAPGELLGFPFRYFIPGGTSSRDWTSFQSQSDTLFVTFAGPGEPAGGEATSWRERSVAATRWTLEIAEGRLNPDNVDDLVIYVRHSFTPRDDCP